VEDREEDESFPRSRVREARVRGQQIDGGRVGSQVGAEPGDADRAGLLLALVDEAGVADRLAMLEGALSADLEDALEDMRRANERIARMRIPVEVVTGYGESIPRQSATCDTAVTTLTLCSVSDPMLVLRELRRVLRPDGQLILLEHGLSEDAKVARWQQRLNPIQKVVACGCNLTRPIAELVEKSGFRFETVRKFYAPKLPRTHGWITIGVAK